MFCLASRYHYSTRECSKQIIWVVIPIVRDVLSDITLSVNEVMVLVQKDGNCDFKFMNCCPQVRGRLHNQVTQEWQLMRRIIYYSWPYFSTYLGNLDCFNANCWRRSWTGAPTAIAGRPKALAIAWQAQIQQQLNQMQQQLNQGEGKLNEL